MADLAFIFKSVEGMNDSPVPRAGIAPKVPSNSAKLGASAHAPNKFHIVNLLHRLAKSYNSRSSYLDVSHPSCRKFVGPVHAPL